MRFAVSDGFSRFEVNLTMVSSGFVSDYWAKKVHKAIKDYYLNLPGLTIEDWQAKVVNNPRSFNLVWRSALRTIYPNLELNDTPPPSELRRIYNFSGRSQSAPTDRQHLAVE